MTTERVRIRLGKLINVLGIIAGWLLLLPVKAGEELSYWLYQDDKTAGSVLITFISTFLEVVYGFGLIIAVVAGFGLILSR